MLRRLQDVFIDQFIASFDEPPARLTLDIDTYDDRRGRLVRKVDQAGITYAYRGQAARTQSPCDTHGRQQPTFFHGHYDPYQYQPRVITCAENDQVVMLCLLFGTAHAALEAQDDIAYLVERLREVWPDVDIELRADSGFAVPRMYGAC